MARGRATKATCAALILERERSSNASRCRAGVIVTGLESDGGDQFFCGGGSSGTVRAVRRRAQATNGRSKAGAVPPSTR